MTIVELQAGLFLDAGAIAAALGRLAPAHVILRIDLSSTELREEVWDRALAAILDSDLVVVT